MRIINLRWVLFLASLGFFMSMMDSMIVTTAATDIRNTYGISLDILQWALNAYNVAIAAVLLFGVSLGEKFGRKRIYILGTVVFTFGSIMCALSPGISIFIVGRIIQGFGASVMTPLSMAILTNAFPIEERGRVLGIWSGIGGLALIVGPSLGGFIVSTLEWSWIFWINAPIGLITVILSVKYLPESFGQKGTINFWDTFIMIIGLASIVIFLSEIATKKLSFSMIVVGIIGIVAVLFFITHQNKARNPMMPLKFFKSHNFSIGNISTFFLYSSMYGIVFFLPQYLQITGDEEVWKVGLELLPWTGTLVVVAPFAGKMIDKYGSKMISVIGLCLQGGGYALMLSQNNGEFNYYKLIIPLVLAGVGLSMAGPALQKVVLSSVDKINIGKASGIYNVFRLLGGSVGTAISVIAFYSKGSISNITAFNKGFDVVLLMMALLSILGMLFALLFKPNQGKL